MQENNIVANITKQGPQCLFCVSFYRQSLLPALYIATLFVMEDSLKGRSNELETATAGCIQIRRA